MFFQLTVFCKFGHFDSLSVESYVITKMVMLVTSSALFTAVQLPFNIRHFRVDRVDSQRLYVTVFARTRIHGFQQGIQVGFPKFERVRPAHAVL
jgi:hypothetical protein